MGLQVKQGRYRKRIKELDDKILHLKYIKEQKGFIKVFM